jgi:hypothetical protein
MPPGSRQDTEAVVVLKKIHFIKTPPTIEAKPSASANNNSVQVRGDKLRRQQCRLNCFIEYT